MHCSNEDYGRVCFWFFEFNELRWCVNGSSMKLGSSFGIYGYGRLKSVRRC